MVARYLCLVVSVCAAAGGACTQATVDLIPPPDLRVRVENRSGIDFDRVLGVFLTDTVEYGPVPDGKKTSYAVVGKAFEVGYFEIRTDSMYYVFQPMDDVGEALSPGRYTYLFRLEGRPRTLGYELRED